MAKAQVVAQCAEPGASLAKNALVHGINANVKSLVEEAIDEDLEALDHEVEKLQTTAKKPADKHTPKRQPLPSRRCRPPSSIKASPLPA